MAGKNTDLFIALAMVGGIVALYVFAEVNPAPPPVMPASTEKLPADTNAAPPPMFTNTPPPLPSR